MSTAARSPGRATIALLAGFGALAPMAIDMYLPGVPALRADLGASPEAAAATLSVFLIGLALGQLIFGPFSDRFGRRRPLIAGLGTFAIGTALAAMAGSVEMLIAARAIQGLGGSAVTVTGRAIVRDLFDHRETARFLSLLMLIGGLAPVLAPAVGSAMLAAGSWRLIFLFMMAVAALLLVGTALRLKETRSLEACTAARRDHPLRSYLQLLRDRRMIGYLTAAAFNMSCFFTYIASAPLTIMQVYAVPAHWFSLILAVNALGLVFTSQLNRRLLTFRTPEQILRFAARSATLLAVLYVIFATTLFGGLPVLLTLIFLVIASSSIIQANTMAGALSVDPSRSGSAAALFGATVFGAGVVASFLAGLLFDGSARPMMALIAVALAGTAVTLRLSRGPSDCSADLAARRHSG